jgi:hypothetical protein
LRLDPERPVRLDRPLRLRLDPELLLWGITPSFLPARV